MYLPSFKFLSSCSTASMAPTYWVFWDLDGTLFKFAHSLEETRDFANYPHFTKMSHPLLRCYIYMIYLESTRKVFKILLDLMHVRIAFITNASYKNMSKILEDLLALPIDSLKNCPYINGAKYQAKYYGIKALQLKALVGHVISKQDFVLLVDNMLDQVEGAFQYNFAAILAQGCAGEIDDSGNLITYVPSQIYLAKIVEVITQKIDEEDELRASERRGFTLTHAKINYGFGKNSLRPYFA